MDIAPPPRLRPEWYDAIFVRTSRRRYTGEPVPADAFARLEALAAELGESREARIVIVPNEPDNVFMGWIGSYGRIEGAPLAALLIGPVGSGETVGRIGEAFILEATTLGIGTCWVAGNFHRFRAAHATGMRDGEHVMCATPLGIPTGQPVGDERVVRDLVRAGRRKPLERIAPGAGSDGWPDWARSAVGAVHRAPSGTNRQPWRLRFEDGALVLHCPPTAYVTANIDRGIAMLHVELGAMHAGVSGHWERLGAAGMLRFVPDESDLPGAAEMTDPPDVPAEPAAT